jgi:hypothetical protein
MLIVRKFLCNKKCIFLNVSLPQVPSDAENVFHTRTQSSKWKNGKEAPPLSCFLVLKCDILACTTQTGSEAYE